MLYTWNPPKINQSHLDSIETHQTLATTGQKPDTEALHSKMQAGGDKISAECHIWRRGTHHHGYGFSFVAHNVVERWILFP
jgi:hypothetical protein